MFLRSSISKHICSSRERYLPPLYELYIRISYIRARDLRECILWYISKRTFFKESEREESFKKHLISYRVIKDIRYFGRDDRKMAFTGNEFYLELSIDVSVASSRLLSIISCVSHENEGNCQRNSGAFASLSFFWCRPPSPRSLRSIVVIK